MPLIDAGSPLPQRPRRVLVAGTAGSGKTTVARRVAIELGIPHVEIDALFHGPGWTPRSEFEADVRRLSELPAWVTEWQYAAARELLVARADLLVWLDLPRAVVMRQVVTRTVRRRLRREVLWNGNVEAPLRTLATDPGHIVRWAWSTHSLTGPRVASALERHPGLVVVRLHRRAAVERWLAGPLVVAARP